MVLIDKWRDVEILVSHISQQNDKNLLYITSINSHCKINALKEKKIKNLVYFGAELDIIYYKPAGICWHHLTIYLLVLIILLLIASRAMLALTEFNPFDECQVYWAAKNT